MEIDGRGGDDVLPPFDDCVAYTSEFVAEITAAELPEAGAAATAPRPRPQPRPRAAHRYRPTTGRRNGGTSLHSSRSPRAHGRARGRARPRPRHAHGPPPPAAPTAASGSSSGAGGATVTNVWTDGPHVDPHYRQLHTNGFVVYKRAIETPAALLADTAIKDRHIYPAERLPDRGLPQTADRNDGKDKNRLMSTTGPNVPWKSELRKKLEQVFENTGVMVDSHRVKKRFNRINAIMSLPLHGYDPSKTDWQPGDQGVPSSPGHIDEAINKMHGLHDADIPLSVMVAFMPNTRLRVRPFGSAAHWHVVVMQPGDVLFFRGDLVHHGVGYNDMNARVHCHLYERNSAPAWPISIHQPPQ